MVIGREIPALGPGVFRPQPFGVTGETLVQPDVAPAPGGHAVAEPLVCQFVGDEAFRSARAVAMVGAEDRNPLRFKRNVQIVLGHHDGVAAAQWIGAEQLDEQLEHLRLTAEVVIEIRAQPAGMTACMATGALGIRCRPYIPICSVAR